MELLSGQRWSVSHFVISKFHVQTCSGIKKCVIFKAEYIPQSHARGPGPRRSYSTPSAQELGAVRVASALVARVHYLRGANCRNAHCCQHNVCVCRHACATPWAYLNLWFEPLPGERLSLSNACASTCSHRKLWFGLHCHERICQPS